ncbi:universal stress protein [Spongisporangium articulatum]|uniref:Universal stress protein n=1 Tax=Spongisporangium articulatum TaxID=3362603 RepID=A0ABW8APA0_9ACTN
MTQGRVVVGYDGRWQGPEVLDAAAAEAERRGVPLSLVTLIRVEDDAQCLSERPPYGRQARKVARRALDEARAYLAVRRPGLRVACHVLSFDEVDPEVEPFRSCAVLVLGDRGNHDAPPRALGSASRRLSGAVAAPLLEVTRST